MQSLTESPRRRNAGTRRDRTALLVEGFASQMTALVEAYQHWCYNIKDNGGLTGSCVPAAQQDEDIDGMADIILIDTYRKSNKLVVEITLMNAGTCSITYTMLKTDKTVGATLVRQGLIPSAPYQLQYVVSIRVLDLYRSLHCRCPRLAIQPFVKGLLDLHGVCTFINSALHTLILFIQSPFVQNYAKIFSTCYDVYLEILENNRKIVMKMLRRDGPFWCLKNTCPACSYKLEGEEDLVFKILITMDGNNSLKWLRRDVRSELSDSGEGHNHDRPDPRSAPGDYYLTREEVDKWMKGVVEKELAEVTQVSDLSKKVEPG